MDSLDDVALLQIVVLQQDLLERDVEEARKTKRRRRPRRYQTRPWLAEERRRLHGHNARLMEELRVEDPQSFFNYLRMEPAMFDELAQRMAPRIEKRNTIVRNALPTGLKLAITVTFLASGDKYPSLMNNFRLARNTISVIIPEVCQAVVDPAAPCSQFSVAGTWGVASACETLISYWHTTSLAGHLNDTRMFRML